MSHISIFGLSLEGVHETCNNLTVNGVHVWEKGLRMPGLKWSWSPIHMWYVSKIRIGDQIIFDPQEPWKGYFRNV